MVLQRLHWLEEGLTTAQAKVTRQTAPLQGGDTTPGKAYEGLKASRSDPQWCCCYTELWKGAQTAGETVGQGLAESKCSHSSASTHPYTPLLQPHPHSPLPWGSKATSSCPDYSQSKEEEKRGEGALPSVGQCGQGTKCSRMRAFWSP